MSYDDALDDALLNKGEKADSTWSWATVTSVSPLRVRFDGDTSETSATPSKLAAPIVGERVWVQIIGRRLVVHGIQGQAPIRETLLTFYNTADETGTHVLDPRTRFVRIKVQAGGGSGAGTTATGSSEHSVGSGGGGGAYIEMVIPVEYVPSGGIPYWVGAGGASGTGDGNDGTQSGVTLTTGDVTCEGGDRGISSNTTSSAGIATGGIGQTGSIANIPDGCLVVHKRGGSGGDGWWYAPDPAANPSIQKGGRGGSSGMGNANARETGGNGTGYSTGYNSSGVGPGTGGGGACSGRNHSAFAGGSGTAGAVHFEEYLA